MKELDHTDSYGTQTEHASIGALTGGGGGGGVELER